MTPTQSLRVLRQQPHLSYSQINTYLTCSLRYYFQYVKGFAPEHTSSALILGSTVHASLARYYDGVKEKGEAESPDTLLEFYRNSMTTELAVQRLPASGAMPAVVMRHINWPASPIVLPARV